MAEIARQSWKQLLLELQRRLGRRDDPAVLPRLREAITAAYFDICCRWHHHDLDSIDDTKILNSVQSSVPLEEDTMTVLAVQLRDPADLTNQIHTLIREHPNALFGRMDFNTHGQPKSYARWQNRIYFNRLPDKSYRSVILYYRIPAAPDFDNLLVIEPEIGRWWDERILELAAVYSLRSEGRLDVMAAYAENFKQMVSYVPEGTILETNVRADIDLRRTPTHAGAIA